MFPIFYEGMNDDVANGDVRFPVDEFAHGVKRGNGVVEFRGFGESNDGGLENGLGLGAREDGGGTGAWVGGDEVEESVEVVEAVGGGEGVGHPMESGVGVAEGVDGGGPIEEVEVQLGE